MYFYVAMLAKSFKSSSGWFDICPVGSTPLPLTTAGAIFFITSKPKPNAVATCVANKVCTEGVP